MRAGRWRGWRGRAEVPARPVEPPGPCALTALRRSVLLLSLVAAPAWAQLGLTFSIASDDRFRGESTTDERPLAGVLVSYDDPSGVYAGVSGSLVLTRHDGVQPAQSVQYLGYAHRLDPGLSLDVGVTNHVYGKYFTGAYARQFAEAYVGLVGRHVSSHLFFAPDYDDCGGSATYAEVNAQLFDTPQWSISSHVGVLAPPKRPYWYGAVADWRLGATRHFGRLGVSLNWIEATRETPISHWRSALVVSASRSF